MNMNFVVAANLKRLRTERNLSLGQLAELSSVSKVMLSQLEKGETNPTINTIWKIAAGLKVPYTSLLEQQRHNALVVKKADTASQQAEDGHYRLYCYFPSTPHRNFELFQMELDKGCQYGSVGHPEKSQEYLMVLEGQLTLEVSHSTFLLQAGDAIAFDASTEHIYRNNGTGILKTSIINFYPA